MNSVIVVYAYDRKYPRSPWIYGVFTDKSVGFKEMIKMEESEEYGHLIWSNNIVKLS